MTAVEDEYGNVLNLGRRTRTVSPALKKALDIRDETCRFPGCCANKYTEFHHVIHWSNFGPTNPDNLVKLCRFHHDQLHQGHYTIHLQQQTKKNHGQKWLFKTATGETIELNPVLPQPKNEDFFEVEWPNIDSQTAVSRWRGKPLDYPRVIKDLLWCKHTHKAHHRNRKS
ncbi:MAG: HNH endonuclease [Algicola sp.]|nr:HNH endonuclease [Algicola sp.]